jgi:hypothetical protein
MTGVLIKTEHFDRYTQKEHEEKTAMWKQMKRLDSHSKSISKIAGHYQK